MHTIKISLSIRFSSKWHCGSGEAGMVSDRLIRRDSRGRPYLPGSTLKGVIRDNCERLSRLLGLPNPIDPHGPSIPGHRKAAGAGTLSPMDTMFGDNFHEGILFFKDAYSDSSPVYDRSLYQTRICMDRACGVTRDKSLFTTEYALSKEFTESRFITKIEGGCQDLICSQTGDFPLAFCILVAGVLSIDRLGGDKSTGAGNVEVSFDSIEYNGDSTSTDEVLDYLDYYRGVMPELFKQSGRGV